MEQISQKVNSDTAVFLGKMNPHLITLFLLPIILIIINPTCLFHQIVVGSIDSWIYFGYFLDLKQHLISFYGTYYGTRLPWILPGFLAYHLFSPLIAKYILYLTVYYTATFSLYGILKRTVGQKAAFLTAIYMGVYQKFLISAGSEYIDGSGIAYLLLTFFLLTPSNNNKRIHIRLFLAGLFCSCFVFTQLFLTIYIPLIALYFFFLNRPFQKWFFLKNLIIFIIGFLVMTTSLCTINYYLNGEFLFFNPIINWTSVFIKGENPWWSPISQWWIITNQYSIPVSLFFGSFIMLIFQKKLQKDSTTNRILFFQVFFVLNILIFIFFQFVLRQPVIQYGFYLCYLYPSMFMALGGMIAIGLKKASLKQYHLSLFIIVIFALTRFLVTKAKFPTFSILLNTHWKWIFFVGTLNLPCFLMKRPIFKLLGILSLSLSFCAINITTTFIPENVAKHWTAKNMKTGFFLVNKCIQKIKTLDPSGNSLFWYEGSQPYFGSIFRSVSSAYLWSYRLINEDFPQVHSNTFPCPDLTNHTVFILTKKLHPLEEANISLATIGFKGELIKEQLIENGDIDYTLSFIKVSKLEEDPASCP